MTTREPREPSRREERDSHGRRPHSSSRSRWDDPSPRRRRDDRRHESDRARYRSRDEESAKAADRDPKRNKDAAQRDDPLNAEAKSLSDAKNDPSTRNERSPRGTKRLSESRESWRPRTFFQHDERGSAGQGGRRYDRQASDYGRQRDQKERHVDREKQKVDGHSLEGKVEPAQEQNDGDSTWKHDGFFQLEEEAPLAKRRPPFQEMKMSPEQEPAPTVAESDSRSRKPDQPGPTSAMREERRNYRTRGFGNHRSFVRPDDRISEGDFLTTGVMAIEMDMIQGEDLQVGEEWTETGLTTQMAGEATYLRLLVIKKRNGSMNFMIRQTGAQHQRPRKNRLQKLKHCWRCSYL